MPFTFSVGISSEESFVMTGGCTANGKAFKGGKVQITNPDGYTFEDCKVIIDGVAVNCAFKNCAIQGNRIGCTTWGTRHIPISPMPERRVAEEFRKKVAIPGIVLSDTVKRTKLPQSSEIIDGATRVTTEDETFTNANEVIIYEDAKNCTFRDCQKVTVHGIGTGCTFERCGWVIGHLKDSRVDRMKIDDRQVQIQWTPPRTNEDITKSRDIALAAIARKYM